MHQVIVGSSANPGYSALWNCVEVLRQLPLHPDVAFHVNPGSRQVITNVAEKGGLQILLEAGAVVHQSGCLGCIGMGQAPGTGQVSLRTFPRNFKGRSGTLDDRVYLCSPETAVAAAVHGRITDPRKLADAMDYPDAQPLEKFTVVEKMLRPPEDPGAVEIIRGPNIKPFPHFPPLEETLEEKVLLKVPDNITTDHILPAGSEILPLRSNIPAISEYVYKRHYPEFVERIKAAGSGIVVGGENYGQGSSREHAAIAPRYLGVKLKLVKSFARIHKANLVNFGIVPLVFDDPGDYDSIAEGDILRFPKIKERIASGEEEIPFEAGGRPFLARLQLSRAERESLLAGGLINAMREAEASGAGPGNIP